MRLIRSYIFKFLILFTGFYVFSAGYSYGAVSRGNSCRELFKNTKIETSQNWSDWLKNVYFDLKSELKGDIIYTSDGVIKIKRSKITNLRQRRTAVLKTLKSWVKKHRPQQIKKLQSRGSWLLSRDIFSSLNAEEKKLISGLILRPKGLQGKEHKLHSISNRLGDNYKNSLEKVLGLPLHERLTVYFSSVAKIVRWGNGPKTSINFNLLRLASSGLRAGLNSLTWLTNPSPVGWTPFSRKSEKIYLKIKKNKNKLLPNFLNEKEMEYLVDNDILDDAILYQEGLKENSIAKTLRTSANGLFNLSFVKGPLIASSVLLATLTWPGETLQRSTYISETMNGSAPVVEVILDSNPIPHTALRIGDKVYNPSQATLNVIPVEQYISSMPGARVIQTIPLSLSLDEIQKIESNFSKHLWHLYNNKTGFYDCTTVISDTLKQETKIDIPSVVNASPTLMLAWLKAQNILGSEYIEPPRMIYQSSKGELSWKLPVRAVAQSIEAKLFYMFAPVVSSEQAAIRDSSDLFFVNEEYENLIRTRVDHFYNELIGLPEISSLVRLTKVLKMSDPESEDLLSAQNELRQWLVSFKVEQKNQWEKNFDPALTTEHEAMIRAVEKLLNTIL